MKYSRWNVQIIYHISLFEHPLFSAVIKIWSIISANYILTSNSAPEHASYRQNSEQKSLHVPDFFSISLSLSWPNMLLSKQKKPYYTIIQIAAEGCGLKLVGRETSYSSIWQSHLYKSHGQVSMCPSLETAKHWYCTINQSSSETWA